MTNSFDLTLGAVSETTAPPLEVGSNTGAFETASPPLEGGSNSGVSAGIRIPRDNLCPRVYCFGLVFLLFIFLFFGYYIKRR